jgi:hypothetical protein
VDLGAREGLRGRQPPPPPVPQRATVPQFDPFSSASLAAMLRRSVAAADPSRRVGGPLNLGGDENEDPEGHEEDGGCCRAGFALDLAPTAPAWSAQHGFGLLVDKRVAVLNPAALACATALAVVARHLCDRVFKLPLASVLLYIDVEDVAIAFNGGGKLHLNVRWVPIARPAWGCSPWRLPVGLAPQVPVTGPPVCVCMGLRDRSC